MMTKAILSILVVVAVAAVAHAELTLIDDFEGYEVDSSIHLQGEADGFPMWYTQANMGSTRSHEYSRVVVEDGDKALKMTNRDFDDGLDTVYTALYLGSANELVGSETTLYLRWKAGVANDMILGTNQLYPGYDFADANNSLYQGTTNYSYQGVRVRLSGDGQYFRAANGRIADPDYGYYETTFSFQAGQWYEMWMWLDNPGDRAQFYVCQDGGTPQQMVFDGDDGWWNHYNRMYENNAVWNLKFFHGGNTDERIVYLDTIAVDTGAFTHDRIEDIGGPKPGDFDGDGDVDLDDFVILKQNFGVAPPANGDADGDGDVDLDDFVILKQNFGTAAVPEPASLSLLAFAALAVIRRKR